VEEEYLMKNMMTKTFENYRPGQAQLNHTKKEKENKGKNSDAGTRNRAHACACPWRHGVDQKREKRGREREWGG